MTAVRQALARLVSVLRKDALDRELDEELAAHIELATEEHVRRGASVSEARRRALIELGGIEPAKQVHRDSRGLPSLDGLLQDVRYAVRGLRRSPGFTLTAVATLAIGIGVNAAVFTVTNAVLFKGFRSIDGNDRILYIGTQNSGRGCCVSYPDFVDWRAQSRSFEGLGTVADLRVTFSDASGFPESYTATQISANAFQLLGQQPILGRDFSSADEMPGAAPVAILGYGFWERRYAKDPAIVGRTVRVNGAPAMVIGVMAQGFSFPQNQDLWLPLVPTPDLQRREARGLWFAFGRMTDGVTFESARAELETIGRRLARAYPQTNEGWVPQPRTFTEFFIDRNAATTYGALWGAVGFVLLIACANLANLMLARAIGRSREISMRMALGAGRWRVSRQLLLESLLLSTVGGLAGWWMAKWSVRAYELMATPPTRSWADGLLDYTMDGRVLAYLIAISIGTSVLFGLAPALRLSRLDVNTTLKDGGRGTAGGERGRRLSALVVSGEMALAVVLLAGAGVMARSFMNIHTANLGIDPAGVVTMLVALPDDKYPGAEAQISFYGRVSTRLEAIPGVESIAIANSPPTSSPRLPYELAGAPPVDVESRPTLSASAVGPGYFRTLRAAVLSGREFDDFDGTSAAGVAIVNERFASTSWPGEDPLGKRLRLFDGTAPGAWLTVVGVVANVQSDPSRGQQGFEPRVYVPYRQQPAAGTWIFVRSQMPVGSLAAAFRHEIQTLDPDLPIWLGPLALEERLAGSGIYWSIGSHAALFLIFAAIALLLASVGLYAVIAHSVSQRTQEIGVRMAIGGTARDILTLVFKQGMAPLAVGLTIGLAASIAVTRVLRSELVGVSPADPATLIVACAVLMASAMLGCWIPARRAMRVDPIVALRHE